MTAARWDVIHRTMWVLLASYALIFFGVHLIAGGVDADFLPDWAGHVLRAVAFWSIRRASHARWARLALWCGAAHAIKLALDDVALTFGATIDLPSWAATPLGIAGSLTPALCYAALARIGWELQSTPIVRWWVAAAFAELVIQTLMLIVLCTFDAPHLANNGTITLDVDLLKLWTFTTVPVATLAGFLVLLATLRTLFIARRHRRAEPPPAIPVVDEAAAAPSSYSI